MDDRTIKKNKILYIESIVFCILIIIQTLYYCYSRKMMELEPNILIRVTIYLTGMFLCGILILSLANDKPWDKQNRALFRSVFILCVLFHFDIVSFLLIKNMDEAFRIKVFATLVFFTENLLVYSFWIYVCEELHIDRRKIPVLNWICRGELITELILLLLNLKFGFLFYVIPGEEFSYGKYVDVGDMLIIILYVVITYVILKNKDRSFREKATLLSFQIFQLIAHVITVTSDAYATLLPAYLFSILLIYINVFSVRSKKVLEQQAVLEKQKTALMISQIQPHFLYNVLTTISNLCVTDPEEAEETTILFAQYLRTNIDSLQQSEPVPFKVELGHIRTYIELEKKRFGDKINVEMNCREMDFPVPVLGLQPIVENSIKHGIRGKETPGHIKISSCKVEGGYEVVIEDDGVGFDMNAPKPDDGRQHVGMLNVKGRLKQMCGAEMTVLSSPGNGCRTVIHFPENNGLQKSL